MSPRIERNTAPVADRDPLRPYHEEFVNRLRRADLSEKQIYLLVGHARHFLVWLERDGTSIETVDDVVLKRFRDHDCRCARPRHGHYRVYVRRPRKLMSGAFWLVRFFEETGRTRHPGEYDEAIRLLEAFLQQLAADGYKPTTLGLYRRTCRHFIVWLQRSRIELKEVSADIRDRFLRHECLCPGFYGGQAGPLTHRVAVERFVSFLGVQGVAPEARAASGKTSGEPLPAFSAWLRCHRGLRESSIDAYVRRVRAVLPEIGDDPGRYDAALLRDTLLRRFEQISQVQAKNMAIAMRMYLRFLASCGVCPPALVGAVPTAPSWRLAALPRYIPGEAIERVIASCDTTTATGIRDRAILLLLARLALRAGDITGLELDDLDWTNARVRVCGKSRYSVALPLPQDAGDAVLAYLEQARPRVHESKVFLRIQAPHRALSRSTVIWGIVSRALEQAGIDNPPLRGAYLFRHSVATALLRNGASLDAIGALLRHRSPNTTAIYAKVDRPMLQEVAQPWIGGGQ